MRGYDFICPPGPLAAIPPASSGGSKDSHGLQLQVSAHLQQAHARWRDPVAEVVVIQSTDHHLQGWGRAKVAEAACGVILHPTYLSDPGNHSLCWGSGSSLGLWANVHSNLLV